MIDLKILALLIIIAPLVGAIIPSRSGKLTCALIAFSTGLSLYVLYGFLSNSYQPLDFDLYTWAKTSNLIIPVGFYLDNLTVSMMAVVNFISLMVHIYSIGYMHDDPGYQRFFRYISLFTFAMLMLVMSNNFMQLFFGWEGVGLVSYLLIGFWYKKPSATYASLKAFIINRVGDVGFIVGIAAVLHYGHSLYYLKIFNQAITIAKDQHAINLICISLFIGAMAKSAQIPLHVWLPDSMEGPTPISALIHAATMVTAGIFMIVRMAPLYEYSLLTLNLITMVGAATCLFMGLLAIVQSDIKRIIAYSTISQLGYMMVACGVSAYNLAMFHLVTHAFFKALLFLAAGSVILALHHEQNIFKMGNLRNAMPITFFTMLIGTLALVGFPGTSGFYSKDLIIEAARDSTIFSAKFAYFSVLISVFVTSLYSFRLLFVVFFGDKSNETTESHAVIWIPLVLLAIPSLFIGVILLHFIKPDLHMFWHSLTSLPFILVIAGAFTAWLCYIKFPDLPERISKSFKFIYQLLVKKYGFDLLNENYIMPLTLRVSAFSSHTIDKLLLDNLIVNDPAKLVGSIANRLRKLQTGYLYHYVFMMITGFFMLLIWIFILGGV